MKHISTLFIILLLAASSAAAQAKKYYTLSIPTRDGKHLSADLYANDTVTPKPVILVQTPYNKNHYRLAVDIPPQAGGAPFPYDSAHYNYVVLDWRGFYESKDAGIGSPNYDRGLDGYDAVEWIGGKSWCDGKVGTWGPSALGQIQFMTAKHRPPHLVCSVPLVKDFKTKYTDFYYGGDFRKEHVESEQALGLLGTDLILAHPTDDVTWSVVESSNDYPDSIAVPMLLISGWYDHFPDDVIRAYYDLHARSAPAVRAAHKLIMGPWEHSGVGKAQQGVLSYPNAAGVSDSAALRFFDYYLRDIANGYPAEPSIRYYQMGRNEWRSTGDWYGLCRAGDTVALYFAGDHLLDRAGTGPSGIDTITFDPRDPSPTVGGARLAPFDPTALEGPQDLRDTVETRGDVVVYSTPPLEEDLEIDGGMRVLLSIASNRFDTDFGVRLCDVYPDGRSIILTQGIRRARFRNGFRPQDTAMMTPGSNYSMEIDLQNIAMTFLRGHRLRVDITSSNYPQYALNLNNGGAMYVAGDTLVARNLVLHGANPSFVAVVVARPASVGAGDDADGKTGLRELAPNPTTGATLVRFSLGSAEHASLRLYDILGREAATLFDGMADAGEHTLTLDAASLPAGAYLCRLQAGGRTWVRRVVVR